LSINGSKVEPWTNQGDENKVLIPPLSFGEYLFEVMARQPGGFEWSDAISYGFTIKDAWYKTPWAYGSFALVGILMLWGLIRISTNKLRKEKLRLQNILHENPDKNQLNGQPALQRLKSFSKLLDRLNKSPGWTGKTSEIFQELRKLHPVDSFGIGITDPNSGEIQAQEVLASNGSLQRRTITISGTQNFPIECINTKKTIWISNLADMGPEAIQKLEFKQDEKMNSLLYVPLKVNNKIIGYMSIKSQVKNVFDDIDLQTFRMLAAIVALNKK